MGIPVSDCRQLVPIKESQAIFKLISHADIAFDESFPRRKTMSAEPDRSMRLDNVFTHQPTRAECYGCVDWFPY
jgi:hypothetical protein